MDSLLESYYQKRIALQQAINALELAKADIDIQITRALPGPTAEMQS